MLSDPRFQEDAAMKMISSIPTPSVPYREGRDRLLENPAGTVASPTKGNLFLRRVGHRADHLLTFNLVVHSLALMTRFPESLSEGGIWQR